MEGRVVSGAPTGGTPFLGDPDYTSWTEASRLHGQALALSPPEQRARLLELNYIHGSVHIRMKQSRWFGEQVMRLRATRSGAGEERRRCFEAFLFFARGVLDCEAFYAHRLCDLDMKDRDVSIRSIGGAASKDGRTWPELARVLDAHLGSGNQQAWFHHFNRLRTVAAHRSVIPTGGFIPLAPSPDINFVPEDLDNPHGTFAPRDELGLGAIVQRSHDGVRSLVSEMETILLDYIRLGGVTL